MAALDGLTIAGRETRHETAAHSTRPNRGPMDWDDVRVFLAVAREGSRLAAGRALGLRIEEPSVLRATQPFGNWCNSLPRTPSFMRPSTNGERNGKQNA